MKQSVVEQLHEDLNKFKKTVEELNYLKSVASDLKNYKRMIKIKKYD